MRLGKTVLVWSVALLTAVNPAAACRWRGWCGGPSYSGYAACAAVSSCYSPCYSACDTSCGAGYVTYPNDNCPICQAEQGAPVTTNKEPSAPTPPTFESTPAPTPAPSLEPAPAEPLPGAEPAPRTPAPSLEPAPAEPAPTTPAPTTPPAPAPGGIDDLFQEPADKPAAPAAPGDMPAPAAPAEGGVDDLFKEEPATKPAAPAPAEPAAPAPGGDADDLFKDLDDKKAASDAPAAPADKSAEGIDDLFNEPAAPAPMSSNGEELKSLEAEAERLFAESAPSSADPADGMRLWTDNTGKYQVRARLMVVSRSHVRLLKENGKFTTVPYERLSQQDLAFVRQHAERIVAAAY
jgi:hypothetical protein